jgi:hypothetical protein
MEESENSDIKEIDPYRSDDSSECHNFISHELDILDRVLSEIISNIENSPENTILSRLRECFGCIDDIMTRKSVYKSNTSS